MGFVMVTGFSFVFVVDDFEVPYPHAHELSARSAMTEKVQVCRMIKTSHSSRHLRQIGRL